MISPNAAMTGLFERPLAVLSALSAISVIRKTGDDATAIHGQQAIGLRGPFRLKSQPFDRFSQESV
jgi:hypothetical protein